MKHFVSSLAISALIVSGSLTHAGGLSDEVMEAPVVIVEEEPAPAGTSINSTFVIIGVVAALLIAAAVNANDDDDDPDSPPPGASDIRLKQDITLIGTTPTGLPLYSFRYIGQDQLYSGVMAQDVLMHTPKAVVMQPNGYLAVRYDMLGIQMEKRD